MHSLGVVKCVPHPRRKKFAEALKSLRARQRLTLRQAASRAGISCRTWCYWEAGERFPPLERDCLTQEKVLARLSAHEELLCTETGSRLAF